MEQNHHYKTTHSIMKKIFFVVLSLLAMAACNNENDEVSYNSEEKEVIDLGKVESDTTDEVLACFDGSEVDKYGLKSQSVNYVCDLKMVSYSTSDVDLSEIWDNNLYYRNTIDLNMGACGKYIYLYCAYSQNSNIALKSIRGVCGNKALSPSVLASDYLPVTNFNGNWTDANEGAGGYYVYLAQSRTGSASPIKGVLVTASSKSKNGVTYSYNGYTYYPIGSDEYGNTYGFDLNRGTKTHKKYIYLWYRR